MVTAKNSKTKTIEVSTETYVKVCGIKTEMEAIFKKKISFDALLCLWANPKMIDYSEILSDAR